MARRTKGELVRFGYERRKILGSPSAMRRLFQPDKTLKLSVSRIEDLECDEILELGIQFGKHSTQARPVHGWFELHADDVVDAKLNIEYDEDPPRHAHIIGWPDTPSERNLRMELLFKAHIRKADFGKPVYDLADVTSPCEYVEDR